MALHFDPAIGLTVDDTTAVRADIEAQWKAAFKKDENTPELNTEPETPAGQLIDGMTALVAEKDSEILRLSNMFNPNTATGMFQDALGKIYFLERHVAEPTLVTCQCAGLQGTIIPYGAVVQDVNGYNYYNTIVSAISASGQCESVFRCGEYGAIETEPNSVTKIITVIPGWDSVNNAAAGVPGRDVESQTEFEQRRVDSVAKNAHGLAEAVEGTVYNISGVIACRIEQNRSNTSVEKLGVTIPGHSVYLSVYGGEPAEIAMAMHRKLDAGCGTAGNTKITIEDETNGSPQVYYYEIPETTPCAVKVAIEETNSTAATIADDIKNAILDNFNGQTAEYARVKMGDTLYASRFYKSVINAGVSNLTSIEIAYPANAAFGDKAAIPLDQMPTLAADNITVIVEG